MRSLLISSLALFSLLSRHDDRRNFQPYRVVRIPAPRALRQCVPRANRADSGIRIRYRRMPEIPDESLEERVRRNIAEHVVIIAYDPVWSGLFADEKAHLLACLPAELIGRVEHFG